jgi:hypothetical protein
MNCELILININFGQPYHHIVPPVRPVWPYIRCPLDLPLSTLIYRYLLIINSIKR